MRVFAREASLQGIVKPPLAFLHEAGVTNCPFSSRPYAARSLYVVYENLVPDASYAEQGLLANASGAVKVAVRSRQQAASIPRRADTRTDFLDGQSNSVVAYGTSLDGFDSGDPGIHVANIRYAEGLEVVRAQIDRQGTANSTRTPAAIAGGLPTSNLRLGALSNHSRPIAAYVWDEFHENLQAQQITEWMLRRFGKPTIMSWERPDRTAINASRHGFVTDNSGASSLATESFYTTGGFQKLVIRTWVKGSALPVGAPDAGLARIRYSLMRMSDGAEVYASGQTFAPDAWGILDLTFGNHTILPGDYKLRMAGASNYMSPVLELAMALKIAG